MKTSPVILFTYNRLRHTIATVESLRKNSLASETELLIFSDAAATEKEVGTVMQVRNYLRTIQGFRNIEIIERETNYGLDKNIINGVSEVLSKHETVIVLEDDLQTSTYFLRFMNEALDCYKHNDKVVSVHGYLYPVTETLPETFFVKGADCWGWATWRRAWKNFEPDGQKLLNKLIERNQTRAFDFEGSYPFTQMLKDQIAGKNRSWAIRWYASAFLCDMYTLFPGRSLVFNAGTDGSGINVGHDNMIHVTLSDRPVKVQEIKVEQNEDAYKAFARFHHKLRHPSLLYRIKRKWRKLLS